MAGSGICCGWSSPSCSGPGKSKSPIRATASTTTKTRLARTPFTSNPAFRNSLFSTRQSLGLKMLTQAVQQLEDITGEEVDVEEGAIATAFKKVASEELEKLYPLKALADAHQLPIQSVLTEYQQTLMGIQSSASDDCVRILTETGALFEIEPGKSSTLAGIAHRAGDGRYQAGSSGVPAGLAATRTSQPFARDRCECVEELKSLLGSEQLVDSLDAIDQAHGKGAGRLQSRLPRPLRPPSRTLTRRPSKKSRIDRNGRRSPRPVRRWRIPCSTRCLFGSALRRIAPASNQGLRWGTQA